MPIINTAFRSSAHLAFVLLLGLSGACDDNDDDDDSAGPDASLLDSGTLWTDAGIECCKPSAKPGCCMMYGGAKNLVGSCGFVCDGMPLPDDPAWRLVNDAFGCPMWSSVGSAADFCGSPPPPADASTPAVP